MKNLKHLGVILVLTFVLSLSAFAGEMNTPPCAPGDISTPPCTASQMVPDDSAVQGELNTPSAANTMDFVSVVDAAMNLLSLF